ncbi:transcription factor DIVARICATA-like isoform X1 [Salvia splendens]|uniref:transcription factor DIVARICATA-like isoform X1 n=1 Tax=Salvia splendens TaxID=180675 RepID=UPI00110376A2|nr:transcription factor DIVARICATA-like isoform X1 [Salvia splendens]
MATSIAYRSSFSVLSQAFPVASKMDSERTSNNCFWTMGMDADAASKDADTSLNWTREEEKAFEIALKTHYNDADVWGKIALAVPGKTVQDLKLHYEALSVMAVESGKMPLSIYPNKGDVLEEKKLESEQVQRGLHWTEEEHRQFLHGLHMYGKGEWEDIAKYSVRTRSSSQVASHAQKFFRRLSSTKKEGKRLRIIDITTLRPEQLLAFEKETTSSMLECCKGESSTAGTDEELLPGNIERAAVHAGTQQLSGCATVTSGNAFRKRGRPKKALSTDENKLMRGARYPRNSTDAAAGQDIDLFFDGHYDIGASTDILDDVDLSFFPHFMD